VLAFNPSRASARKVRRFSVDSSRSPRHEVAFGTAWRGPVSRPSPACRRRYSTEACVWRAGWPSGLSSPVAVKTGMSCGLNPRNQAVWNTSNRAGSTFQPRNSFSCSRAFITNGDSYSHGGSALWSNVLRYLLSIGVLLFVVVRGNLCGKNDHREQEAMRAAERALEARIVFWDGVEAAMKNPVVVD
jgi:hypothetical protein